MKSVVTIKEIIKPVVDLDPQLSEGRTAQPDQGAVLRKFR